jgi:DNA-binding HxlR family transcriptional regulator
MPNEVVILRALADAPNGRLSFEEFWRVVGPAHETQSTLRGLRQRGHVARDVHLVYAITAKGRRALEGS